MLTHNYFFVICVSVIFSYAIQKCVAYTGNNMRKQTPAPDKKEKDVSCLYVFFVPACDCIPFSYIIADLTPLLSLPHVAI